jgi:carboxyl-terminal processing protease
MKMPRSRERVVWAAVTVVLLAALAVFVFSPRLLAGSAEDETQAYLSTLAETMRFVRDNYVDADKSAPKALFEGAMKGMLDSLGDPYSTYLTAEDMQYWDETTTGQFGGVGLTFTKQDKVGGEVISSIEGTPAFRAGITAGDLIIAVDGESCADLSSDEIARRIRGAPKTGVTLTIRRGENVVFDVKLVRDIIEVPNVRRAMIPGRIGYMRITQFMPQTYDKCREAITYFRENGYTSLIIDVRNNPGGLLNSVVNVANLFIAEGPIVSTRSDRSENENFIYTARRSRLMVDPSVPIVVLVDKGSASAAEILAGALKDTGRAVLIGATTYGKGSVQQIRQVGGASFKLTMSRYLTPSGAIIDKKGIPPDRAVAEPALTPAEEKSLSDILNATWLADFVKAHPRPSTAEVDAFIGGLRAKGIVLNDRYLRRLLRNEVEKTNNSPPLYDLDFDLQLDAAVKALSAGEISAPGK